jgi:hypothetical protein
MLMFPSQHTTGSTATAQRASAHVSIQGTTHCANIQTDKRTVIVSARTQGLCCVIMYSYMLILFTYVLTQPEGHMLTDRYTSMVKRNIVEYRQRTKCALILVSVFINPITFTDSFSCSGWLRPRLGSSRLRSRRRRSSITRDRRLRRRSPSCRPRHRART